MFGFTIISKSRLEILEAAHRKHCKIHELYRWFAGWKDLDIIWKYIYDDTNFGGISRARADYAKARNTNEYGEPLK